MTSHPLGPSSLKRLLVVRPSYHALAEHYSVVTVWQAIMKRNFNKIVRSHCIWSMNFLSRLYCPIEPLPWRPPCLAEHGQISEITRASLCNCWIHYTPCIVTWWTRARDGMLSIFLQNCLWHDHCCGNKRWWLELKCPGWPSRDSWSEPVNGKPICDWCTSFAQKPPFISLAQKLGWGYLGGIKRGCSMMCTFLSLSFSPPGYSHWGGLHNETCQKLHRWDILTYLYVLFQNGVAVMWHLDTYQCLKYEARGTCG